MVCDRYVASSLVLDPIDGVERDFVWGIYRSLAAADLSIILRGDPRRCSARAAARGHYSRFHTADIATNARERVGYADAAAVLRAADQWVIEYDVGTAPADEVAERLAEAILAAKGGRR